MEISGFRSMDSRVPILDAKSLSRVLSRMAHEIAERNDVVSDVVIVGIQRGGVGLADRLGGLLGTIWGQPIPTGTLDVGMHRDDLNHRGTREIYPTKIPFDVTGKTVVLADDVLYSGRTVRAAMDSLSDFGRPKAIQLAVLVDRGHRQLPIQPDFVGKNVRASPEERIRVELKESGGGDLVFLEKA